MSKLPLEVINNIFMFNPDHCLLFKNCLFELHQRVIKKKLMREIHHMKYGPLYSIPKIFKVTDSMYTILLIIRSN